MGTVHASSHPKPQGANSQIRDVARGDRNWVRLLLGVTLWAGKAHILFHTLPNICTYVSSNGCAD